MELDELDKKVKDAFKTVLVGEIVFSDSELAELCKRNLSKSNYDQPLRTSELLELRAQRYFVVFVNITRKTENDSRDWLPELLKDYFKLSGRYISTNDFYSLMRTDVFPYIKSYTAIFTSGQRYYNTFRCHALVPRASLETLFEICFSMLAKVEVLSNASIDSTYLGSSNISVQSNPDITMGLKLLAENYPDKFFRFVAEILNCINQLLDDDNVSIGNDRLREMLVDWYDDLEKRIATVSRISRTGTRGLAFLRKEPDVFYALKNNRLFLNIAGFNLGDAIERPEVFYEIIYKDKIISSGNILCFSNRELYEQFGYKSLNSEDKVIPLDDLKLPRDSYKNLQVVVNVNGKERYSSGSKLRHDFILFDAKDDAKQVTKNVCKPGSYLVYCDSFSSTITRGLHKCYINPLSSKNLYYLRTEDLDTFGTDDYFFTFIETSSLNEAEFAVRKGEATYHYGKVDYEISNEIVLKIPSKFNYENYGIRIINKTIPEDGQTPNIIYANDKVDEIIQDGKITIVRFNYHFNEKTPYEIRLFHKQNYEMIRGVRHLIYIKDFHISYKDELLLERSVEYKISSDGEDDIVDVGTVDESGNIQIPYFDGFLVLSDVPLLQVKIGSDPYKTFDEISRNMYCDEIPDLCSISIKPENLSFTVLVDHEEVYNKAQFGRFVHPLYKSNFEKEKKVWIRLDSDSTSKPILLTTIHYKPVFLSSPITHLPDPNKVVLYWNPTNYIGPKATNEKEAFDVKILGSNGYERDETFGTKPIRLSGFETIGSGEYKIKIWLHKEFSILKRNEPPIDEYKISFRKIDFIRVKYPTYSYGVFQGEVSSVITKNGHLWMFTIWHSRIRDTIDADKENEHEYVGDLYICSDNQKYIKTPTIKNIVWRHKSESNDIEIRYVPNNMSDEDFKHTKFCDLPQFGLRNVAGESNLVILHGPARRGIVPITGVIIGDS